MAQRLRSYGIYYLSKPAVFEPRLLGSDYRLKVKVVLAGRTRLDQNRTWVKSRLQRPVVVFAPAAPTLKQQQIQVIRVTQRDRARGIHSRLPLVLVTPVSQAFYGPKVTLTRIRPPQTRSKLRPPFFYAQTSVISETDVAVRTATEQTRHAPHSRLSKPTVLQVFTGPKVTLAGRTRAEDQRRHGRVIVIRPSTLEPYAVELREETIRVTLAPSRRPITRSRLQPPFFYAATSSIRVTLAGRARLEAQQRAPHSHLPLVIGTAAGVAFYGPKVYLAPSRRPVVKSRLSAPTTLRIFTGPKITLAGQTRLDEKRRRGRVIVINPATLEPESVELREETILVVLAGRARAEFQRRAPHSFYRGLIFYRQTSVIDITLARIRPPQTRSRLRPPITLQVFSGPRVYLTRHSRGAPKSKLRPPTVVTQPTEVFFGPKVKLSGRVQIEMVRRAPHSKLRPGIVEPSLRAPDRRLTILTRLVRIRPAPVHSKIGVGISERRLQQPDRRLRILTVLSRIRPPQTRSKLPLSLFRRPVETKVRVTLARIRPPTVHSRLTKPLLARPPFFGPETTLVRIRPAQTRSKLRLVIFRRPVETKIHVWLAPSSRGRPKSRLRPPVVVHGFIARPILVSLQRIRPPAIRSRLRPPTVIGAAVTFFGPVVHLVRITPPGIRSFLTHVFAPFIRKHGDVCGTDSATQKVTGTSSAPSKISGTDSAVDAVCGTDQEAT